MEQALKILLLEDSPTDVEIIQRILRKGKMNCEFRIAIDRKSFLHSLDEFTPDVVLSDHSLPQFSSYDALDITRQKLPYTPFILVTGTASEEYAAGIIKQGADDYILKDRMARLPAAIEASLSQRKARKEITDYKYALDQSAIVAITDQKGIIQHANDNFCRIAKYPREELIGQDHRIINSGYHPSSYIKDLWTTVGKGNIWKGEFRNRAKDGSFYWVDTLIIPFLNEKKKPYQYLSIRIDITGKKKIEEELQKSIERLKYVTKATSDIIWELNFETKSYIVHEGKEKLFGANKVLNWQLGINGKYIVEEDRQRIRKSFREAKSDPHREFWDDEYRVYASDNTILYIINHAIFIRDENGGAIRAIGAITDISDKKKLETDLLEQQRKEQLKITATTLAAQEKERNAIGQELHDNVNQILVGTKLLLSLVKSNPSQAQAPELISTSISNLQNAIEENRRLAHELVSPDLETENIIDRLSGLFHKMLKTSGINTYIDTTFFNESLLSNEQKLAIYRIAQEQCTNIIKYSKATLVNVILSSDEKFFKMTISDNGQGMDSKKKITGIGLRNVHARVSIFNGFADIDTAPGKGFLLQIEMPLKK